jgi:hypothetical protein
LVPGVVVDSVAVLLVESRWDGLDALLGLVVLEGGVVFCASAPVETSTAASAVLMAMALILMDHLDEWVHKVGNGPAQGSVFRMRRLGAAGSL